MEKTPKDYLVDHLEELEEKQLKRFKQKLNEVDLEEGFNNIPRGRLENADPLDIADLLISFYMEDYGIRITVKILEAMNEKKVAEKLKKVLEKGQHFVDKHRIALINRVSLVNPILDVLLSKELLNDEKYAIVRAQSTSQEMLRKLYEFMKSWGTSDKDIFFQALKDNDLPLIKDLGGV